MPGVFPLITYHPSKLHGRERRKSMPAASLSWAKRALEHVRVMLPLGSQNLSLDRERTENECQGTDVDL